MLHSGAIRVFFGILDRPDDTDVCSQSRPIASQSRGNSNSPYSNMITNDNHIHSFKHNTSFVSRLSTIRRHKPSASASPQHQQAQVSGTGSNFNCKQQQQNNWLVTAQNLISCDPTTSSNSHTTTSNQQASNSPSNISQQQQPTSNSSPLGQQNSQLENAQRQVLVRLDASKPGGATDSVLALQQQQAAQFAIPSDAINSNDTATAASKSLVLSHQISTNVNQALVASSEAPLAAPSTNLTSRQVSGTRKEVAYDLGTKRNSEGNYQTIND